MLAAVRQVAEGTAAAQRYEVRLGAAVAAEQSPQLGSLHQTPELDAWIRVEPGGTIRLSVTIDRGGRIEAIRLAARKVPESLTKCVRSKVLRWDFDIRDDPYTYGPFKIKFAD